MEEIKIGDVVRLNSDTEGKCLFTVGNIITHPSGASSVVLLDLDGREIIEKGLWVPECFTAVERK